MLKYDIYNTQNSQISRGCSWVSMKIGGFKFGAVLFQKRGAVVSLLVPKLKESVPPPPPTTTTTTTTTTPTPGPPTHARLLTNDLDPLENKVFAQAEPPGVRGPQTDRNNGSDQIADSRVISRQFAAPGGGPLPRAEVTGRRGAGPRSIG